MSTPTPPPHKVFCVSNIKTHVPLILDVDRLNYNSWQELFTTHCEAYVAIDHIDASYVSMGDLPVKAYCTKIKSLADLLENIDPQAKVLDKNLVIYIINSLSPRYDNVASIIRHRLPFPTFEETRSILLSEEQRLLFTRVPSTMAQVDHSSSPS